MTLVNVEHTSRIYRQDSAAVKALDDVSVTIGAGEFTTLVGPSGSGKTTLLNQIGALDEPSSGRIQIAGQEITGLSRKKRTVLRLWKIGFVFQEYNLIGVLSAQENVEYVLMLRGVPFRERRQQARLILAEVGLEGLETRLPNELSGGQQQRVAVARAIVSKPAIVLANEPTANLDSKTGAALLDMMRRLNDEHGVTFVFSTHDPMVNGAGPARDPPQRRPHRTRETPRILQLVLLWSDHENHLLGVLPWLILLACPLLHKYMHGGHGNHGRQSDEGDK